MYAIGFLAFWWLGRIHARREHTVAQPDEVGDILFYGMVGVIIGGRAGAVLFYHFSYFLEHPLYLFRIWEGGMSFHGGLLGVSVALWLYQRRQSYGFLRLCDFVAPGVPIGLGAGRIGNFINGELWGRATDAPWAIVFPHVDELARHPSQLYQAFLEGLVLFTIVWIFAQKSRPAGAVVGLFVLLYGVFRLLVEFAREPDGHIGYLAFGWLTQGQALSVPMVLVGAAMLWLAYNKPGITKDE